jgi:hypothetical protein
MTVLLTAFGRAIAEVGAVMIVGGNIDGVTRVMTTAIALETSKGDLPFALALGVVLISVVLAINAVAYGVARLRRKNDGVGAEAWLTIAGLGLTEGGTRIVEDVSLPLAAQRTCGRRPQRRRQEHPAAPDPRPAASQRPANCAGRGRCRRPWSSSARSCCAPRPWPT